MAMAESDEEKGKTSEGAMALAIDWAVGRRSYCNLIDHGAYTAEAVAVMDTQEVVRWTAIAVALHAIEFREQYERQS